MWPMAESLATSTQLSISDTDVETVLRDSMQRHHVPGAAFGVWQDGEQRVVTAGIADTLRGTPTDEHTVFGIGSLTKMFVAASLLCQPGLDARLDARARTGLRSLPAATGGEVTARHLLNHTSGLPPEYYLTPASNPDDLASYLDECARLSYLFAPGEQFSYSNVAYCYVAGLLQAWSGNGWMAEVTARTCERLGLAETRFQPLLDAGASRAVGHTWWSSGDRDPRPVRPFELPVYILPGAGLWTTIGDLLRFGVALMPEAGATPLGAEVPLLMREEQIAIPERTRADAMGLGLVVFSRRLGAYGHGGIALGQRAELRVLPRSRAVVALLCNGRDGMPLFDELLSACLGIPIPAPPTPSEGLGGVQSVEYQGLYDHLDKRFRVEAGAGGLHLTVISRRYGPAWPWPADWALSPIEPDGFLASSPETDFRFTVHFRRSGVSPRPRYLHAFWHTAVRLEES